MAKKFDPSKPHGTVYGHPAAKFEQNGVVYKGDGEPLDPKAAEQAELEMAARNREDEEARKRELAAKGK